MASALDSEYGALIESGFTESEWFALPRDERARRVAYKRDHAIINLITQHDSHEKGKKKAASERKRKR